MSELQTREAVLEKARTGIERHRKGQARLRFARRDGAPIQGLTVEVIQKNHEFDFGCPMADVAPRPDSNSEALEHAELFKNLFNCATALCYWDEKWDYPIEKFQGQRHTEHFLRAVDWARASGLRVKGHPLVWTIPKGIPQWLRRYDLATQMRFLEIHVRSMIACAGEKVAMWDLCNEMLWEPSLRNLPHREWPHIETNEEILSYLEPAMRWAREENPDAIYSINDYGLEEHNFRVSAATQRRRLLNLVAEMKTRGVAPDALGTQAHIGWHPIEKHLEVLDELTGAGLPLQITEFWARAHELPGAEAMTDAEREETHAAYVADFYTMAFGHPAVEHLTYWGYNDFFAPGKTLRPNRTYDTLRELIRQTWTTRITQPSDAEGCLQFRGFYGQYLLRYRAPDGSAGRAHFTLRKGQSGETTLRLA